jgi:hypothetical protein
MTRVYARCGGCWGDGQDFTSSTCIGIVHGIGCGLPLMLCIGGVAEQPQPPPLFVDHTVEAGLAVSHQPSFGFVGGSFSLAGLVGGGAVGDFNGNGLQDIFLLSGGVVPDRLFMNNGDGTFTDYAAEAGVDAIHLGVGVAVGDFTNNGRLDIFITSLGTSLPETGKHILYRNEGYQEGPGVHFVNVAEEAGINYVSTTAPDGFGIAVGDYDLDGHLDLYVSGWIGSADGNRLFRNNGDGSFTDVTEEAGLLDYQWVRGFAPRFADMNGNGWPDLLFVGDYGTSRYFVNNGDGTFTDMTEESGTGLDGNGMGQTIGDFENRGMFDWYVTSIYSVNSGMSSVPGTGNMFYRNLGNHQYEEVSVDIGVNDGNWGWGAVAVDFNHNTYLDIATINGWGQSNGNNQFEWANHPTRLFMNQGDGTFADQAIELGLHHTGMGRGMVNFDSNNNGRQDVLIFAWNGPLKFYRNIGPDEDANWLRIFLDTAAHHKLAPNGIGSVVSATVGDLTMTRMITPGDNYLSQSELSAHFGLGSADTVDTLTVHWNDGSQTVLHDVPANQTMTISATAPNPADLNGDGVVDGADLFILLSAWGACADPGDCPADLNGDGSVDGADLLILLTNWG